MVVLSFMFENRDASLKLNLDPKVLSFYDDFCSQHATSLKADGKDILSVTIIFKRRA
jgi:hypothetical protein